MKKNWEYLGNVSNHMEHYKKSYGLLAGIYKKQMKSDLLKMVPMKNKFIIEIGCGNGFLGEIAKEMGITIDCGIEYTRSLLKFAKGKYKRVMYGDVTKKLPFKNNSVDVVLLPEVIAHVSSKKRALLEIYRILKPEGYLILTMPDKAHLKLKNLAKIIIKGTPLRKIEQRFEPLYFKELEQIVKNNGFRIIKHYKTFHRSRQVMLAQKTK